VPPRTEDVDLQPNNAPMVAQVSAEDFLSIYRQGFVRVAACRPLCRVADPELNLAHTLELVREGHERAIALMVFTEIEDSEFAPGRPGNEAAERPAPTPLRR